MENEIENIIKEGIKLGEKQIDCDFSFASHDACEYLKPSSGAEIGVMSYNFPLKEWTNPDWINWLKNAHKNLNVKFKVVGGPKIEAVDIIKELTAENVIELRLLTTPVVSHILYATNPKQLLFEEYHTWDKAVGFHFTPAPFEKSWGKLKNVFDRIWQSGKPTRDFGDETIEDINVADLIIKYLYKHEKVNDKKFIEDLKNIVEEFHKKGLAKKIYFTEDPCSLYWSSAVSGALRDLMGFGFVEAESVDKEQIFYRMTEKGKKLPEYYSHFPSWRTLEKFSSVLR